MSKILLVILVLFHQGLCAQSGQPDLINISTEQGLPSNEIYCVFKDSKQYIWLASDQGVVRMNGETKEVLDTLPDNTVFKIREDLSGRIWFFSYSNKWSYFYNEKVVEFPFNENVAAALQSSVLLDVYFKDINTIVLNTAHQNNYEINIDDGGVLSKKYFTDAFIDYEWEMDIVQQPNNALFARLQKTVGTLLNTLHFSVKKPSQTLKYTIRFPKQNRFQFYGAVAAGNDVVIFANNMLFKLKADGSSTMKELPHEILSLHYDSVNASIMVGFREGGLMKLAAKDFSVQVVYKQLSNLSVSSICIDHEGGEWFATLENGLYYNKSTHFNKLTNSKVFRLFSFNDSTILYGNAQGLFQLNKNGASQVGYEKTSYVYDIQKTIDGELLVAGNYINILSKYQYQKRASIQVGKKQQPLRYITSSSSLVFNKTSSYFARLGLGLLRFRSENFGIVDPEIITQSNSPERGNLFMDANGHLWMTGKSNLYKYDSSLKQFEPASYNTDYFKHGVLHMTELNPAIQLFALRSQGLLLMKNEHIIGQIKEENGLINNNIKYILPLGNDIWLLTTQGITHVAIHTLQPLKYSIRNYSDNVGLQNKVTYHMIAHNNDLIVAASEGIFKLTNVLEAANSSISSLPLYIRSIHYNNTDTVGVTSLELPYSKNRISIHLDAISFNAGNKVVYEYRIINKADTWYKLGSALLELQNLAAGKYTIEMRASIPHQNRMSAIQTIQITIIKPWWQTLKFYLSVMLLVAASIYFLFRKRIERIQKNNNEKTQIQLEMMNLEQTALRSQMNPHFIFNSLSSIQELVISGNKEEANDYLVKFARLIRKTLELSQHAFISLADEKEYLTEYVAMEKMRMEKGFDFIFEIDPALDAFKTEMPNMMLQPIVENSIRHGIKHLNTRRGLLRVTILKKGTFLLCRITDNGIGIQQKKLNSSNYNQHKSFGLDIVEKRLMGLPNYNVGNYFIKVDNLLDEQQQQVGTLVEIHLPLMQIQHD